jgi:Fe2+ transport system protein FeoA
MNKCSLNDLQTGQSGIIQDCPRDPRLYALGFKIGVLVSMVRAGPLDDPIQVKIMHTDIVMRRDDAEKIKISRPWS